MRCMWCHLGQDPTSLCDRDRRSALVERVLRRRSCNRRAQTEHRQQSSCPLLDSLGRAGVVLFVAGLQRLLRPRGGSSPFLLSLEDDRRTRRAPRIDHRPALGDRLPALFCGRFDHRPGSAGDSAFACRAGCGGLRSGAGPCRVLIHLGLASLGACRCRVGFETRRRSPAQHDLRSRRTDLVPLLRDERRQREHQRQANSYCRSTPQPFRAW